MLHEEPVLQDGDLVEAVGLAHDHLPVHGLATGQELRLGDDGTTAPGRPALATALALGLQAGGPLEGGHLVTQVATVRPSTGATSPAARSGHGARGGLRGGIGGGLARGSLIGAVILRRLRLIIGVGARRALATRARAPTAPATAPLAAGPALADVLRRISPGLIGPIGTVRAISLRDLGGLGVGLVAGGVLAALLRGPGTGGGPPTPTAATATAVGSGGLGLSILVMSPGTGPRVGVLLIRPVLGALVTRGGRRLLGSGARRGDPTAPTGPTGVGGLEQERGGRQPGPPRRRSRRSRPTPRPGPRVPPARPRCSMRPRSCPARQARRPRRRRGTRRREPSRERRRPRRPSGADEAGPAQPPGPLGPAERRAPRSRTW